MVCDMIVASDDMELTGAVVSPDGGNAGKELYPGVTATVPSKLSKTLKGADVYVDLTSPDAAAENIRKAAESGVNIIIGTTAVAKDATDSMSSMISEKNTSALISANFAIGVNVFWTISELLAQILPDYDIEIIESHHNEKKDSPSGTAAETLKRIQEATGIDHATYGRSGITGKRGREIGMHSIRAGSIVGEHTVLLAGNDEMIELKHTAISREAFASGCLTCIRWIHGKKDGKVHGMDEVIGV